MEQVAMATTPSVSGGGKFTHSVNQLTIPTKLEQAVDVPDGKGGMRRTWTPLIEQTLWVSDRVARATYIDEAGQLQVQVLHFVVMRYQPNIQSGARFRFNGPFGVWYIKTINDPDNRRHWLQANCTEVPS